MSYYEQYYQRGRQEANSSWINFFLLIAALATAFNVGMSWERSKHAPKPETAVSKTETKSSQGMIVRVK